MITLTKKFRAAIIDSRHESALYTAVLGSAATQVFPSILQTVTPQPPLDRFMRYRTSTMNVLLQSYGFLLLNNLLPFHHYSKKEATCETLRKLGQSRARERVLLDEENPHIPENLYLRCCPIGKSSDSVAKEEGGERQRGLRVRCEGEGGVRRVRRAVGETRRWTGP